MKQMLILSGILFSVPAIAQKADETIQQGNELYKQKQWDQAENKYNDALKSDPTNTTAKYNLANTTYRRGKQDESVKMFDELGNLGTKPEDKSRAYYNKGAVLSSQKKLEESIDAYKNALRQNPNDKEARENLQKALLELKKKQPPKKEDDKKKKQDQQQKKKQPQPKMNPKEAEQRLKLLEQKEKEVQQRMQKEKSRAGGGNPKDW